MDPPIAAKTPDSQRVSALGSSDDRRGPVGSPTGGTNEVDPVARVGASFLASRPWIVLPIAIVNGAAMTLGGAPLTQRLALVGAIGVVLVAFFVEARVVRGRTLTSRWLSRSLSATVLALGVGCLLSGGIASPLVPLLGAPLAVAFAAFGRRAPSLGLVALVFALGSLLALVPAAPPWAPPPASAARVMTLASLFGATALAYTGVAGLVQAHAEVATRLERMRLATLEEAASRIRATEQVGARVAHELKNPLAAIQALLQLLARSDLGAESQKRAEVALSEVERMSATVREYLELKRPLTDVEPRPVDVVEIAHDVAAVLDARAASRGLSIVVEGSRTPLIGDPRRVREALLNVVANAVLATPKGGAPVKVTVEPSGGGARVVVTDRGAGMDASTIERIGTPYFTTREGGTGLGVAIARAAIELHRGEMSFASRPGEGTVVTMLLRSLDSGAPS